MKISANYQRSLDRYLEWSSVITPASGTFQEDTKPRPNITVGEEGISAAEALCIWESQGKSSIVRPEEEALLNQYAQGKSQRDWWTREIGWWNKNASYMPEEFLHFLGPLPFIELFSRCPITRIVRYYYDNNYRVWNFRLDSFMESRVARWRILYYERDDRNTSLENAWRMESVKWIQPISYRFKRIITGE